MDKEREEKERRRKDKVVFPTCGGEATNPENMEALYVSKRLWGTEELYNIPFLSWNRVDEYRDPVDPTSL